MVVGVLAALASAAVQADEPLSLQSSPMLSETPPDNVDPWMFMIGDRVTGRADLETIVEGNAEYRKPGLTLRADRIEHDHTTDIVELKGNVRANAAGDRYTATEGRLQVDAFEGAFQQPSYTFIASGGHGQAQRLDVIDRDRTVVIAGDYTTCRRDGPDWMPAWLLRADRLEIDREADTGRARGGVLEFQGVPVLPVPSMTFPLSGQRQSGWLPPTIGLDSVSGLNLAVPYYWNIAPNRDATLTPTVMARRGVDLGAEFRYLESNYSGEVRLNWMPSDRLRGWQRLGLSARHAGVYDTGLGAVGPISLGVNLNHVSDADYWRDFSHRGSALSTRLLPNDITLGWGRGDFSLVALASKWQTPQNPAAPITPPYDKLPQLIGRWAKLNQNGFDYSIVGDFTRFRNDRLRLGQPNVDRGFVHAQASYPLLRSWGFLTPKLQLHASSYQFDSPLGTGATSATRLVPTASLDSGLVFERQARHFGRDVVQTLEPRLMYVYTPLRQQNHLPNYDSGLYDFNFASIWAENAFVGNDRIADNNLVTAGLTTRLLDRDTGEELARFGLAQRYRFSAQQVVLPGGVPTARGWSDLMIGAAVSWSPRWSADTIVQYNMDTRRSTRNTVHVRYSPGPFRTVSLSYRQQRNLRAEYADLAWQWPLSGLLGRGGELGGTRRTPAGGGCQGRWYSVGRLNYSLPERKMVDAMLGLEYDAGCWIGRIVVEQLQTTVSSATKRILFQIEFVGLSRIGTNPLQSMRSHIPRYQPLGQDYVPPSRFQTYE